ncbi:hypothetical protein F5148DRAFT_989427 [Russula earlei]|uniref:Uncharacterized protein n=1 Tax=Russula earlei TaxID=71964 RepID=A0ACC0TTD1_9AGAM|nr:hypothetical protein F5148DRAFT_989427 [Russula earlei]
MRAKQPFLSSRPLTTPLAHFNVSELPSGIPTYTPGRPPRHSSLPAPPTVQLPWLSLQPLVRPIFYDPISTITQTPTQPSRRHSIALPPQPPLQANHHNYFFSVPKISVPVDFHPLSVPFPPANAYHVSELTPRGQETSAFPHVRFSERNLIIPSQISMREPRKGWHNRRGDQLWTSKGHYKPAPPGQEYPPDLTNYPDYGEGWMNEEGVRIDMQHRLIPKAPLRSALKRPSQVSIADANPRTWVVHD